MATKNIVSSPRIDRKFVDDRGNLTANAYALLYGLIVRTGGSVASIIPDSIQELEDQLNELSELSAVTEADAQGANDALARLNRVIEYLSIEAQSKEPDNAVNVDYIDFNGYPKLTSKPRRLSWNQDDDTLNLTHSAGVTQQIGLEDYSRITNTMGTTIENGKAVSLSGIGVGPVGGEYYIADGTVPSLYILGVATQDIPAGEDGLITTRGFVRDIDTTGTPYGETWNEGDLLFASPTTAGDLTNIKPTATDIVLPIAVVIYEHATAGVIAVRPTVFLQSYYGVMYSTANQTAAAINTAYAVTFSNEISAGVSIGSPSSRIVFANSGHYDMNFSVQVSKSSSSAGYIWVWLRKNGTDIANSALRSIVQGNPGEAVISRSLPVSIQVGDYVELMWAVDSTTISLLSEAASAFAPAVPSVTMTVTQINL